MNTAPELKPLSTEEKRVRIAEACGFMRTSAHTWEKDGRVYTLDAISANYLPDYFASLDACREAEQSKLQDLIKARYWLHLMEQEIPVKIDGEDRVELVGHWNTTASQRAEAFGRALGLW